MKEHFNLAPESTIASVTDACNNAIRIIGPEGENSMLRHLSLANEKISAVRTTAEDMAESGVSPALTDVWAEVELVVEQLEKTTAIVSASAGHLAVYVSSIGEGQASRVSVSQETRAEQTEDSKSRLRQQHRGRRQPRDEKIVLVAQGVRLTPAEAQSYVVTQRQFESMIPYNNLAIETARAVRSGKSEAFCVPAVQFVVDSVIAALEQNTVARRMPLEVTERAALAMRDAHTIAEIATRTKLLHNFYRNNPYLRRVTAANPNLAATLFDAEYLGTLASAVFSDVEFVGSGALKAIQQEGIPGDAQQLIKQSATLKSFSGIPKEDAHALTIELGIPPDSQHYKVTSENGVLVSVDFSDEFVDRLRGLMGPGVGCPIRQLKSDEPYARTELDHAWNRVVDFLIPVGATVNNPQVKAFYRGKGGAII